MKTGIYMIRNKVNDKKYIGQAVDIDARWATHIRELNDNNHYNRYLQRAWNKYGAVNFEFTIVCLCEEEELDEFEIDMIAHYRTFYKDGDGGYNLTLGGDGCRGYKWTDEQRARRSEQNKEIMNRPEFRKKKSVLMKEYYKDPENRKKTSEAMKGKPLSEEHKAKISEAKKGRPSPKRKAVYCVTNDTIYASTVEAEEKLNIAGPGTVSWACQGKYGSGNGHVYKKLGLEFWFLSEYEEKFGKVAM